MVGGLKFQFAAWPVIMIGRCATAKPANAAIG